MNKGLVKKMFRLKENYIPAILFIALISFGCNFSGNSSNALTGKVSEKTRGENAANSQNESLKSGENAINSSSRQKRDADEQRTLADGSQYVKMKDAYGNIVEFRYFEINNPVKYISVQTLIDGTTSIIIRTREGAIKHVKPNQIENPWQSSLREIALLAGVSVEYDFKSERIPPSSSPKDSSVQ